MKTNPYKLISRIVHRSWSHDLLPSAALLLVLISAGSNAFAGSATWSPSSGASAGDWNTASNWSPALVPNGSLDTATFAHSFTTGVFVSADVEVNGITFTSSMFPSAYTITVSPGASNTVTTLTISGVGITNNSGLTQNFVTNVGPGSAGEIEFRNSATAGTATAFTNNAGSNSVGSTQFFERSSAGNASFTNNGGAVLLIGGATVFFDDATAANGIFTNNGATVNQGGGGIVQFEDLSTAANGIFTNNGGTVSGAVGGQTIFERGRAANAILIANGGTNGGGGSRITFHKDSVGDMARVKVFGNGALDISGHYLGADVGSIEGNGVVYLGANGLAVGANNLSTTFAGLIQDGGEMGGTGGWLYKIGKGKLTLTKANTYTGGTLISGGTLLVQNKTISATGPGLVQVNTGTLGGTGKIDGAVTVGTGSSSGAILLAGNNKTSPGTLTINNPITFRPQSTYKCVLNRTTGKASQVSAFGVTIDSNVPFTFLDAGTGTIAIGTIFRVIDNTSNLPISGRFSNLSNGLVVTSNGTKFKVNYSGGTGNDLTLKVVP